MGHRPAADRIDGETNVCPVVVASVLCRVVDRSRLRWTPSDSKHQAIPYTHTISY